MAAPRYFQVGGFNPDIDFTGADKYNNNMHAKILHTMLQKQQNRHDGLIEMILGITPKGASYLLLTDAEMQTFCYPGSSLQLRQNRRGRYTHDFESLSPTYFTIKSLNEKLSDLRPKSGSREDTSKANKSYVGPSSQPNIDYPRRGAFEHSRLLYRILDNTVEPRKYGATNISWKDDLRIRAFSMNVDSMDSRPNDQRKANPKVLDIGVCDAKASVAPIPDYATTRHIRHPQNKFLMARKVKKDYIRQNQNVTEEPTDIKEAVCSIFADCQEKTASPLVLLVHDEEQTCNFLKNMQVDVSNWRTGLKDLVNPGDSSRGRTTTGHQHHDSRHRDDGRAASPRRNVYSRNDFKQEREGPWGGRGQRSDNRDWHQEAPQNQPQRPYAPVYVIDVLRMYKTFMQTNAITDPVNDNAVLLAKLLNIGGVDETNWWCAGEEACLLIEMWCVMASGTDVDHERNLNVKHGLNNDDDDDEEEEEEEEQHETSLGSAGPHSLSGPAHDDDEDPNTASPPAVVGVQRGKSDYFDEDDDADSDSDSD